MNIRIIPKLDIKNQNLVKGVSLEGLRVLGNPRDFVEKYSEKVPLGRKAEVHEVASTVLFLVSDESSYITGQNIIVDGGLQAW